MVPPWTKSDFGAVSRAQAFGLIIPNLRVQGRLPDSTRLSLLFCEMVLLSPYSALRAYPKSDGLESEWTTGRAEKTQDTWKKRGRGTHVLSFVTCIGMMTVWKWRQFLGIRCTFSEVTEGCVLYQDYPDTCVDRTVWDSTVFIHPFSSPCRSWDTERSNSACRKLEV